MTHVELKISGKHLEELHTSLFQGDGFESVSIALCGRMNSTKHTLLVHELYPVPQDSYTERSALTAGWKTDFMIPLLERAQSEHLAILKIHNHPSGYEQFSKLDDESDRALFPSVHGWTDDGYPHVSAIMLPNKKLIARAWHDDGSTTPVNRIVVVGENVETSSVESTETTPEFTRRHAQIFGKATTMLLRNMAVAVVGCSGTGSIVIEQLARLGIGKLVLIDPDRVEEKNLNRIVNAKKQDVLDNRLKVEMLRQAVHSMGLDTEVAVYPVNIAESVEALKAIAECDFVFGCMDGAEGRFLLNKLATFYLLPYIDLGIRIDADGNGGVDQVCGSVHYLQPGMSTLISRKMIQMKQVEAEALRRTNPSEYESRRKEGYIHGVAEDRPAVISVNMLFAALAVNEFLARLHSFRDEGNHGFAKTCMSLTQGEFYTEAEDWSCEIFKKYIGRGDMSPFLNMPTFTAGKAA
jgi:uncharacterized UPF0146 family protein